MIIELGNHGALRAGIDDQPKVSTIHIPEGDEDGRGGYTHAKGTITPRDFKDHLADAIIYRNGITRLPDHEALLAIVSAWPTQGRERPRWVNVIEDANTPKGHADDITEWLQRFYEIDAEKPGNVEDLYWTRFGSPGQGEPLPQLPDAQMLYTNAGRVISNINDGGGQTGLVGTGTAATGTTFTTNLTLTTNAWAGYRIYAMQTATGPLVWGNVLSNTNAASASVVTIDRWYNAATPGGAAATTPSAGFYFMLADGGATATWFVAMTTTNITPAATDVTLSGEYYAGANGIGANLNRKIAPYAQTSGVASRAITLTPVYTANASDTFPSTFYAIGVFGSAVQQSGYLMKFETSMNASATVAASGDQITVMETVSGS